MAYSIDFRKRAIAYVDEGHTGKELYAAFKIYPSQVNRWRRLLEKTGSLEPQYRETRAGKIDMEELKQAVERRPDAYLSELAEQFNCTPQAIFYALKRLKITLKKDFYLR
jgi:transposase